MTVGEKIKLIRTFRGMTQRELGIRIGLDEKGADNRMAQYETNYRVPKKDMLDNIAKVLNVNRLNFYSEVPGSAEDIMMTFFWLDEDNRRAINLFPLICKLGRKTSECSVSVEYDSRNFDDANPTVGLSFNFGLVDEFMHEWMLKKQELREEKITDNEYLEWKLNWPETNE